MKYINLTLQYLFRLGKGKRFLLLCLVSLPCAIAFALVAPTSIFTNWVSTYSTSNGNFFRILYSVCFAGTNPLWYFIIFMIMLSTISAISSIVMNSLRVGKFWIDNLFIQINDNFFPSLYMSLFYTVLAGLINIALSIFLSLWHYINSSALGIVLSYVSITLSLVAIILIFAGLIMWLPIMSFKGIKPFNALSVAVNKSQSIFWKIVLALTLPIIGFVFIGIPIALIKIPLLTFICSALLYGFLIVYVITLSMISFYDIEGLKRMDNSELIFRSKY